MLPVKASTLEYDAAEPLEFPWINGYYYYDPKASETNVHTVFDLASYNGVLPSGRKLRG